MAGGRIPSRPEPSGPTLGHPVRLVTATSLFDGHDASINIVRRLLQNQGCEVVHLGHNRSVAEIVTAVVQEDVQGVAVSSYQGGHLEFFGYLVDQLRARGMGHVRVFGGGGGVITPTEITELAERGVRIYSPHDGLHLGLAGMVAEVVEACDTDPVRLPLPDVATLGLGAQGDLARALTALENGAYGDVERAELRAAAAERSTPVLGVTGTGGSGKSSLTDELVHRFRLDQEDQLRLAVLAIDPTRRRGGGALLGDRIRMNAIDDGDRVVFRSLATRGAPGDVPAALDDMVAACKVAGVDVVVVETPGIGQGDAGIVDHVDVPVYVMTPEFGAASQLEKIDMLDFAEAVVINKFERRGGADALRDVRRQVARNLELFDADPEDLPVFGTVASRFADDGVTALYQHVRDLLVEHGLDCRAKALAPVHTKVSSRVDALVPTARSSYLADVADAVRSYHRRTEEQVEAVRRSQALETAAEVMTARQGRTGSGDGTGGDVAGASGAVDELGAALADERRAIDADSTALLDAWPGLAAELSADEHPTGVALWRESLSGSRIPRLALPRYHDRGELLRWLRREHVPGRFPFTAGVFPFKREHEDPTRLFAGEGDPFRTNRRFTLLATDQPATRLSTAFDSVTLYGFDPAERPDVYGKVGNAGVSVATLDDMEVLFDGFDLTDPTTSVSMTINGPAPAILAMFLTTAIDQQRRRRRDELGREVTADEDEALRAAVLHAVRGTVQADIFKEDQGQNTCIFTTEFALRMMADVQEWFVDHDVRGFYSVSISGYHIAEAGANPITQLAFTLANAFTYVEAYLARGLPIDAFAPNLSFFFSNGMDPEYAVLGRVARRIWAIAMRDRYGADERSQKLKYHVQTSGRSLHAQEMAFNDIRTTLQALIALYDNCNSLHTNAYDEAITTPTDESVRRALAIQLIINREWGVSMNENPNQGSFLVEQLTDLVEDAVLAELERISERGGVLGAMETGYQRGRIQDESMRYERRKHDGSLPVVGVNTFVSPEPEDDSGHVLLARSTEEEKQRQLQRLRDFQERHRHETPAQLERLKATALDGGNVFAVLMDAVRCCSLGQISEALFSVGGRYRRNV